ncbi:MAG TPA: PEP/pyruvate-binding domain-containing protein [Acidimicrobiia bacterium]
MIVDLDEPSSRDPSRVGGKAAGLARARAAGAAVLPGFVVEGATSRSHMALGAETLPARGSGGARLAVSAEPISFAETLIAAGEELGQRLVARSSTLLEDSGEWAGAFSSYLDLAPIDLPKAVTGCWASAFSVAALERQEAAGVEPGSFSMSVLVQPALEPTAGGWAKLAPDGTVVVRAVKGSPAPLMQGWVSGSEARFNDSWRGDELIELVGLDNLDTIRDLLEIHATQIGADTCEWALTDRVWALQFDMSTPAPDVPGLRIENVPELGGLVDFVKVVALAPGSLGEFVVLPWAIAGIPEMGPSTESFEETTVADIRDLSRKLTGEVWEMPAGSALRSFRDLLDRLSAGDIDHFVEVSASLSRPDPEAAAVLLGKLRSLRQELATRGLVSDQRAAWHVDLDSIDRALKGEPLLVPARFGVGRWEPLLATVVLSTGEVNWGTPASPGIGAGLRAHSIEPQRSPESARGVITATRPIPALAPLLWDASAMVTSTGSPAAHLFEAARSLRVPTVCGLDLGEPRSEIVAVDGHTGMVATLSLDTDI